MAVLDLIRLNIEQRHIDKAIEQKKADPNESICKCCIIAQAATEYFGRQSLVSYIDIRVGDEIYDSVEPEKMASYTYVGFRDEPLQIIDHWKTLKPSTLVFKRMR